MCTKMKKKCLTVAKVPKSNLEIEETEGTSVPLIHMYVTYLVWYIHFIKTWRGYTRIIVANIAG